MAATLQPPNQAVPRSRSRSKSASGREQLERIQKHLPPNVSENITKVTKIVDKISGHEPRTSTGTYTGAEPPTSYQEYHQQNGMNSNYTYGGGSHSNGQSSSQLPYNQQHPYGASPHHDGYGNVHTAPVPHYQSNQHLQPPSLGASTGYQTAPSPQANFSSNMYNYGASPSYHHTPSPSPGPPVISGGASPASMPLSSGKPDKKVTTTAKLASKAEKLLVKQALKSRKQKKHGGMGFGHSGAEGGENGEGEYDEYGEYGDEGGDDGKGRLGDELAEGVGEDIGEALGNSGGDDGSGLGEVLGAIFGG